MQKWWLEVGKLRSKIPSYKYKWGSQLTQIYLETDVKRCVCVCGKTTTGQTSRDGNPRLTTFYPFMTF